MSKTSGLWHFDKTALKRNHFFFSTIGYKAKLYNYRSAPSLALVGPCELVGMKEGRWVSILSLQPPSSPNQGPDPPCYKPTHALLPGTEMASSNNSCQASGASTR